MEGKRALKKSWLSTGLQVWHSRLYLYVLLAGGCVVISLFQDQSTRLNFQDRMIKAWQNHSRC